MANYRTPVRLYLNADRTKVVEQGSPEASTMFKPVGGQISDEDCQRYGLGPYAEDPATDAGDDTAGDSTGESTQEPEGEEEPPQIESDADFSGEEDPQSPSGGGGAGQSESGLAGEEPIKTSGNAQAMAAAEEAADDLKPKRKKG